MGRLQSFTKAGTLKVSTSRKNSKRKSIDRPYTTLSKCKKAIAKSKAFLQCTKDFWMIDAPTDDEYFMRDTFVMAQAASLSIT